MKGECTACEALRNRMQKQNVIIIEQLCYFKGLVVQGKIKLSVVIERPGVAIETRGNCRTSYISARLCIFYEITFPNNEIVSI